MADQLEQQIERTLDQVSAGAVVPMPLASNGPIVLFGAGRGGLIALAGLRRLGVEPAAWADNDRLQGTVEGLPCSRRPMPRRNSADRPPLLSRSTPSGRAPASDGHGASRDRFHSRLSAVSRHVSPARVPRSARQTSPGPAGHPAGQPRFGRTRRREPSTWLRSAIERCSMRPCPPAHPGPIYFPEDLFKLIADEVFVDCGAFDGDTLCAFLARSSNTFRQIECSSPMHRISSPPRAVCRRTSKRTAGEGRSRKRSRRLPERDRAIRGDWNGRLPGNR